MNNPFDYTPSAAMLAEQQQLAFLIEQHCQESQLFAHEVGEGKMFGILITDKEVLYAFSGQVCGSFHRQGFVPPVFDYLAPDGYFKVHEAEISAMNHELFRIINAPELHEAEAHYLAVCKRGNAEVADMQRQMEESKRQRDIKRQQPDCDINALIRESQYQKAELHRLKRRIRQEQSDAEARLCEQRQRIADFKQLRQQKSEALQQWLFSHFILHNYQGETASLPDLFATQAFPIPPSGAGECCEPKLLHYAYTHGLKPIEIGMFWWGKSPKNEVRHHLHFYPACSGKCKPILEWMLPPQENTADKAPTEVSILYDDADLTVVVKPAGLLSVPGKSQQPSLYNIIKGMRICEEPLFVHRLDQDTSGVMVIAKTTAAHKHLQRQFAEHTICKTYIARLDGKPAQEMPTRGTIALPLAPDYLDRPRQKVDYEAGKQAITHYEMQADGNILLHPETGRTHQLRVHCSHPQGLNCPIKGDRLYGTRSNRLYLHAQSLTFTHPTTGERMTFQASNDFPNE